MGTQESAPRLDIEKLKVEENGVTINGDFYPSANGFSTIYKINEDKIKKPVPSSWLSE